MRRFRFLLLLLAVLPATIFLLRDGYLASSDGMIHLYRLFELDRSLHAGVLLPRWFPLSGYGYGLPVLNYYPPLAYYLGEAFHLAGAGYIAAIKLTITTSFVIAACSMFLFACELLGEGAAFVAAIAYTYSPYLLSDAYVRGNFPEMLTMSLLPFALWAFARIKAEGRLDSSILLAALAFAAIILTHHLTAMLFVALLPAYLAFLLVFDNRAQTANDKQITAVGSRRSAIRSVPALVACAIAVALALALSAFYWVPALAELNWVYVGPAAVARFLVNRLIDPTDFFAPSLAYTYLPQTDALKHAFGFPQTLLALLAGVMALMLLLQQRGTLHASRFTFHSSRFALYVLFFSLLVAFCIFMTLVPAAPLWYAISPLRFMQFPWRFQILAAIGIAFLLGAWAKWIGDALDLSLRGAWSATKQHLHRTHTCPGGRCQGVQVSPNTDLGIASRRSLAMTMVYPTFVVALIALGIVNLPVRAFALSDAEVDLTRSDDSGYVVAQNGWSWTREFVPATVQEFEDIYAPMAKPNAPPNSARPIPLVQIQDDGLYTCALRVQTTQPFELSLKQFFFPGWQAYIDGVPAQTYPRGSLGLASVAIPLGDHAVLFRFEDTPLRVAMNGVSLVALVGVLVSLFVVRRHTFGVVFAALVIVAALFAWHTHDAHAQSPIAVAANFEQRVQLVGYTMARADDTLYVTLEWFALNEMDRDYFSFVHLLDSAGNLVAQHDGPTDQGLTPTTRWLPGEIVPDRHSIALRDVPPGEYRLAAGMYLPLDDGYQSLGTRVDLGRVQVGVPK